MNNLTDAPEALNPELENPEQQKKQNRPLTSVEQPIPTKIYALGGLEEIGKNAYVIEHDDEIIIIDFGVKFPDATMPGVEGIIPNYEHLLQNKQKIKAIFITHGHEDHIGGLPYLLKDIPTIPFLYAPKLATELIRTKLKDRNIKPKTKILKFDSTTTVKTKHFIVNFYAVNHSIPDSFGIYVRSKNGSVVSTGDYKFDWTPLGHRSDLEKMAQMGEKGVTLFLADSTNAEFTGYTLAETIVIKRISELFAKAKGRILISTFASNVHRIQNILEVANRHKKRVVVIGRSLERITQVIRRLGHIKIPDNVFLRIDEIKNYSNNKIVIICTGSQGEPMAALSRISNGEHRQIKVIPGDTVIFSSSPIPGNRAEVEKIVNRLTRLKAIVEENSTHNILHTSGHASQEEQKLMLSLIKPKYFMPMHGDYRMLKAHGKTAISVGLKPENLFLCANGDVINMVKNQCYLSDEKIDASPIYVDSGKDTPMSNSITTAIMRYRQILSRDGLVAIVISIDSSTNKLLSMPAFISRGSFFVRDSSALVNECITTIVKTINELLKKEKPTFSEMKKTIRSTIAPLIFKRKRRNPLIIPVILNKITDRSMNNSNQPSTSKSKSTT